MRSLDCVNNSAVWAPSSTILTWLSLGDPKDRIDHQLAKHFVLKVSRGAQGRIKNPAAAVLARPGHWLDVVELSPSAATAQP